MSDDIDRAYPDISDILLLKAQGRRDIAAKTFGEKLAMLESLRERLAPIRNARISNDRKRDMGVE